MSNKIQYVSREFDVNSLASEDYYFAELEGSKISSESELFSALKVVFRLPDAHNWDAIFDWLTDLSWLCKEGYIVYIRDYSLLLADDVATKKYFLSILKDTAEWWDGDVEKCVVGGKKKSFNIYLVD